MWYITTIYVLQLIIFNFFITDAEFGSLKRSTISLRSLHRIGLSFQKWEQLDRFNNTASDLICTRLCNTDINVSKLTGAVYPSTDTALVNVWQGESSTRIYILCLLERKWLSSAVGGESLSLSLKKALSEHTSNIATTHHKGSEQLFECRYAERLRKTRRFKEIQSPGNAVATVCPSCHSDPSAFMQYFTEDWLSTLKH